MSDTADDIARDLASIARIDAVPALLRVVCQTTSMGFAAVARVTDFTWTACAVQDNIAFGLTAGGQLDVNTTLCLESRQVRGPVVIDQASADPVYATHHTPRIYGIESYISVPIVLPGGEYFGNLCAIDPRPANVSRPEIVSMFVLFAELIGLHLDADRRQQAQAIALSDQIAIGELREQFIAVLGHDLRNPLAAVSASAGLLEKRSADPQTQTLARRITTSARRMTALIDDVLDLARGKLGGGFGAELTLVDDLAQALQDVVAELQAAHPTRAIETAIDLRSVIRCDRGRVQQLASNLLANALTHGAASTPVRLSASDADGFLLTVTNAGEPIPPESLGKVFEPFWRRSISPTRDGLGLGLFICAQIVKTHHGTLSVTSTADQGTTFAVHWPVMPMPSPVTAPAA